MMDVLLPALYVLALACLLATAGKSKKHYALAKGVCSVLFLLAGLRANMAAIGQGHVPAGLILLALLLCAFGDVLLGVANQAAHYVRKAPFVAGGVSFMLAHLVFCFYLMHFAAPGWQDLFLPATLVATLLLLEKTDRIRLKKLKPLAIAYTVLVALMAGKAAQLPGLFGFAPKGLFLCMGAVLFLFSDVILLFLYFGTKRHKWTRAVNLVSYYTGVYLIAISASV